jgi:hypothetical protein
MEVLTNGEHHLFPVDWLKSRFPEIKDGLDEMEQNILRIEAADVPPVQGLLFDQGEL